MLVRVDGDVTLEVAREDLARDALVPQPLDELYEHGRDHVLAAVHEGAGGDVQRARRQFEGRARELLRGGRKAAILQSLLGGDPLSQARLEGPQRPRVGADLLHGGQVPLVVAARLVPEGRIGLLVEHDLVDESRRDRIRRRDPRPLYAGQVRLQPLEQRHEIQHADRVVLHERPQRLEVTDGRVDPVIQKGGRGVLDPGAGQLGVVHVAGSNVHGGPEVCIAS